MTIFCLLNTYDSTSSKPTSRIASYKGGVLLTAFLKPLWLPSYDPMGHPFLKPLRSRPMRGVITHVSNPNRITA